MNAPFLIKLLVSATLISTASELAKRSTFAASLLISLPMSSVIALSFLYYETRDPLRVADLGTSILFALVPSLLFFVLFPWFLRMGLGFLGSMLLSCVLMSGAYASWIWIARGLGRV